MKFKSIGRLFVLGISVILFLVGNAHAYLDPGTGSMLLQGVLAAFAVIAVLTRQYWQRLLRFFGISRSKINAEQAISEVEQTNTKENKSA